MTSREDTPTQIYVPALHREIVLCTLPETIQFFDPGLPQTATLPGFFHPQTYPLPPQEAGRTLDELLVVGEALNLATPAGSQAARNFLHTSQDNEKTDLASFAAGLSLKSATPPDPAIAAQKVLLLAWDLETRLLEIAELRRQIAEVIKPLQENLHGSSETDTAPDSSLSFPGTLPENPADLADFPEPDWRLTLAAMAAFIPENALLVTCHSGIRDALRETGLLHPLTNDLAQAFANWPDTVLGEPLQAVLPLWRILGHSCEPKNAPWLLATRNVIVWPAQADMAEEF